jgi:hypothetical protein
MPNAKAEFNEISIFASGSAELPYGRTSEYAALSLLVADSVGRDLAIKLAALEDGGLKAVGLDAVETFVLGGGLRDARTSKSSAKLFRADVAPFPLDELFLSPDRLSDFPRL